MPVCRVGENGIKLYSKHPFLCICFRCAPAGQPLHASQDCHRLLVAHAYAAEARQRRRSWQIFISRTAVSIRARQMPAKEGLPVTAPPVLPQTQNPPESSRSLCSSAAFSRQVGRPSHRRSAPTAGSKGKYILRPKPRCGKGKFQPGTVPWVATYPGRAPTPRSCAEPIQNRPTPFSGQRKGRSRIPGAAHAMASHGLRNQTGPTRRASLRMPRLSSCPLLPPRSNRCAKSPLKAPSGFQSFPLPARHSSPASSQKTESPRPHIRISEAGLTPSGGKHIIGHAELSSRSDWAIKKRTECGHA